jgi:DnaJ-class molecular chaperone
VSDYTLADCPTCDGTGGVFTDPDDDLAVKKCETCGGEGKVKRPVPAADETPVVIGRREKIGGFYG